MYRPDGRHLWDFWTLWHKGTCHLFHLQAPSTLEPEQRHWSATVGHATSRDLVHWRPHPTALGPGPDGAWDDLAVWTGHALPHGDGFAMLYTGTNRAENGRIQRIGLATSADLDHWERHPGNPVLEIDRRWYEDEAASPLGTGAWRDPFVIRGPTDGRYWALLTARLNRGPVDRRGCVALARSENLIDWTVERPLYAPGEFFHLEIPQLVVHDGRWILVFSVEDPFTEHDEVIGTCYRVADRLRGDYRAIGDGWLVEGPLAYGAKLISATDGTWKALYWRYRDAEGRFLGDLADPLDVRVHPDGRLEALR